MHLAAQGGHMLVAGLLISRSAESLLKPDKQGRTCVHLAAAYGQRDMVGLLLGQGAEINAADKVNNIALKILSFVLKKFKIVFPSGVEIETLDTIALCVSLRLLRGRPTVG